MNFPSMATPPTWVHDIGSVGYAGRKEFVGSPLREKKRIKVCFRTFLIEEAVQQVEGSALVLLSHRVIEQEVI